MLTDGQFESWRRNAIFTHGSFERAKKVEQDKAAAAAKAAENARIAAENSIASFDALDAVKAKPGRVCPS